MIYHFSLLHSWFPLPASISAYLKVYLIPWMPFHMQPYFLLLSFLLSRFSGLIHLLSYFVSPGFLFSIFAIISNIRIIFPCHWMILQTKIVIDKACILSINTMILSNVIFLDPLIYLMEYLLFVITGLYLNHLSLCIWVKFLGSLLSVALHRFISIFHHYTILLCLWSFRIYIANFMHFASCYGLRSLLLEVYIFKFGVLFYKLLSPLLCILMDLHYTPSGFAYIDIYGFL